MPMIVLNIALQDIVHTFYYFEEISSCQLTLYLAHIKNQLISSKHGKSKWNKTLKKEKGRQNI